MGGMAVFLPHVTDVVVLLLLVSLPAELFVVGRSRKEISWRGVLLLCAGVAAGVLLGTRLLTLSDPKLVLTLLACHLVAAGAAFLLMPSGRVVRFPAWTQPPVGLLSGMLAGLFGTGGPPLILYYQLSGVSKTVFRGNLMAIFLLTTAVRLPAYALYGLITTPRLLSATALLPAALLGVWIGQRAHVEVSEARFRNLISVALCLIGLLLLLR